MPHSSSSGDAASVRALYNEKAGSWRQKYNPNGPLAHRIEAFDSRLKEILPAPAKVLDFGCGTGNLAAHLAGAGYAVTACDIAERMLDEAKAAFPSAKVDWTHLASDWQQLPFESGTFDAIVSSSVFEYVKDLNRLVDECARVLKPGGTLLVSVPNPEHAVRRVERLLKTASTPIPRSARTRLPTKVRSYLGYLDISQNRLSSDEWSQRVRRAGFELENVRPMGAPLASFVLTQSPLMLLTFRR